MGAVYFLVALFSCIIGSITGMGGGVIIKPVFDIFGTFDAQSIGVLSSFTVLSMATISAARNFFKKTELSLSVAVLVALGSVLGGTLGQHLLTQATAGLENHVVIVTQNAVLAAVILLVFLYMKAKETLPSFELRNAVLIFLVGMMLGVLSSFLGIGGGPINVAAFIFFFSYDTKTAALSSLITILFAQGAKLFIIGTNLGFSSFDLSALPFMISGAVLGALIGGKFSARLGNHLVDKLFNAVQLLVLALCLVNIYRYRV